ncbi:hypothetical protein RJ641_007011 [Dillenia turbinata]|uniref:Uncharacterized protein n=1 Tax=Dillenia turbinata TaxID=194707 RepID=A0AAN8V6G8_9MAGN
MTHHDTVTLLGHSDNYQKASDYYPQNKNMRVTMLLTILVKALYRGCLGSQANDGRGNGFVAGNEGEATTHSRQLEHTRCSRPTAQGLRSAPPMQRPTARGLAVSHSRALGHLLQSMGDDDE